MPLVCSLAELSPIAHLSHPPPLPPSSRAGLWGSSRACCGPGREAQRRGLPPKPAASPRNPTHPGRVAGAPGSPRTICLSCRMCINHPIVPLPSSRCARVWPPPGGRSELLTDGVFQNDIPTRLIRFQAPWVERERRIVGGEEPQRRRSAWILPPLRISKAFFSPFKK